jgi:hypothetical protein
MLSGGVFLSEGGFHAANVQNIGYLPVPAYLCAAGGEISKLDSKGFYDQVTVTVKCPSRCSGPLPIS